MESLLFNRYRLLQELGQGAMGKVLRVADTLQGNREVALKTIQVAGDLTPELKLRFKEEFRAMVKLKHPNTLEVYDFGILDEHNHYFTMEIVQGRELSEVAAEGALAFEGLYPLLFQLLQALGFIHSRGYVHRDVKAQNIRLKEDGTLKLMDFGLMCQAGRQLRGVVSGTPGYLAPEVIGGGRLDGATDLYSVGCLAYELITGRLPFTGKVSEVLRGHRDQAPVPPRTHRPDTPEALERIVVKLLEKDPSRRYRQADEVVRDLAALAGIAPVRESLDQRRSYLTTSALVGRRTELALFDETLKRVNEGGNASLFVGAPAGAGKSRLTQECALHATLSDMVVLEGRCQAAGQGPYEPLVQALRQALPLTRPDELKRFGPVLARLFPQIVERGELPEAAPSLGDAAQEKLRLHDALLQWLEALAERAPIVWFLDDLQLADPQTLEAFNHCIRHVQGGRLLFLATFRNDEVAHNNPLWLTIEENLTHHLKLEPFTPLQLNELLGAMLKDFRISESFTEALHAATAGNPFFVTEVLHSLMEEWLLVYREGAWEFPLDTRMLKPLKSIQETILRRVGRLAPEARRLAQAAAVLGLHFELNSLLAVTHMEEETFFVCLDELLEKQFVLKSESGFTFPHDGVREALYRMLEEPERQTLHQRCAAHLEACAAEGSAELVHALAYHYGRGNDLLKAYEYLNRAGDLAAEKTADVLAITHWLRALEALSHQPPLKREAKEIALLMKIGRDAYILAPGEAVAAFRRVLPLLDGGTEERAALRLEAWMRMATSYGFLGDSAAGQAAAEQALKLAPGEGTLIHSAILVVKATILLPTGRIDELLALLESASPALLAADISQNSPMVLGARVGVSAFKNACCFQGIRPDSAATEYAYQAASHLGEERPLTIGFFWGLWYAWSGRHEEAQNYLEEISHSCRRLGVPTYRWAQYLTPSFCFNEVRPTRPSP